MPIKRNGLTILNAQQKYVQLMRSRNHGLAWMKSDSGINKTVTRLSKLPTDYKYRAPRSYKAIKRMDAKFTALTEATFNSDTSWVASSLSAELLDLQN